MAKRLHECMHHLLAKAFPLLWGRLTEGHIKKEGEEGKFAERGDILEWWGRGASVFIGIL